MNTNMFSVRLTDEQRTQIDEKFPETANKDIMTAFLKKMNENPDNSHFTEQIAALESEKAFLKSELERWSNSENLQIADFKEKITELESRLRETVEKTVKVPAPLAEREMRFVVPPLAWALLREYAKRLETEPQNILIDMFLRYVIEQRNHWFFDFVVRKLEFLAVTGYSYSDVEKWLKTQKQ
ncbi:MAG: hypothetical protein FWF72_01740 [Paludibacter sp.]|nr:hypothetical protein [Paludibacter sp.]